MYRLPTLPGMALFLKNVAFHGILLDALFEEGNREWEEVSALLKEGIAAAVVQPLNTTVFQRERVEDAFRYMAQGKHIGKVLLQVGAPSTGGLEYVVLFKRAEACLLLTTVECAELASSSSAEALEDLNLSKVHGLTRWSHTYSHTVSSYK